jgi:hypothetical protein
LLYQTGWTDRNLHKLALLMLSIVFQRFE